MNLSLTKTTFTKAQDVVIPELFNRRLQTGIARIDDSLGGGFLPGSVGCLTGSAGSGKTTMLLQIMEGLAKQGYKVGYISGEEAVEQLANTCKRIDVKEVEICNETKTEKICKFTKDFDMLVIDSFQALESQHSDTSSRRHEMFSIQEFVKHAKKNECTICLVLHLTKGGQYKGNTSIIHSVDFNVQLLREFVEGQPDQHVNMFTLKNRFGPTGETTLLLTGTGYDFDYEPPADAGKAHAGKGNRKAQEIQSILDLNKSKIQLKDALTKIEDAQRASFILREMVLQGKLTKSGRGTQAIYTVVG
jgi:predicted ATP-dependent serine protease